FGFLSRRSRCGNGRAVRSCLRSIAPDHVAHGEKYAAQRDDHEKQTDELFVTENEFLFAVRLRHVFNFPASSDFAPLVFESPRKCPRALRMSMGSGKTMVVFFSMPISTSVCR